MTDVLIVTHGRLGEALLESASMISGRTDGTQAIGFLPGQGVEDLDAAVRQALKRMSANGAVLCLVDIPGGSPARVAASMIAEYPDLEVLAGVSLPMLLEVLLMRDSMTMPELIQHGIAAGLQAVVDLGLVFRSQLVG
ncbi:MAG: PTS sugar transporter subunit IIA [Bacillota bacterium]